MLAARRGRAGGGDDRGPRRLLPSEASGGQVSYELFGSGWRFPEGHRVRIELFQDDDPFLHLTETASSAALSRAVLRIPIPEPSAKIDAKPTLRKGCCANKTLGTKLGERLVGPPRGDRIKGRDKLIGGPRKDRLEAGSGRDRVFARDGRRDVVRCGKGKDRAVVDRVDRVRGCERVRGKRRR